jgi:hypothetical protein
MKPRFAALLLAGSLAGCGDSSTGPSEDLPAQPVPLSPVGGVQVTTDTPSFSVRNAKGFDSGQAEYTFHIRNEAGDREIAALTVPAGRSATTATLAAPLPRGRVLAWNVTAHGSAGDVASANATFRTLAVECLPGRDPYAKSIVDWFVPACSLAQNIYNDAATVLGPPDAGGMAPDRFFGFISLGEKGYVTVDMEGCAADESGADVRVFQSVTDEEVSLYAAGRPDGPFELLEYRKPCGNRLAGVFSRYCDFDLANADLKEARYFKIEDGEQFPCPGDTVTEGADIDAIQILHPKP